MARRALLTAVLLAVLATGAQAAEARFELPIHEHVLPDGVHRYSATLTVDGKPVEAGLDTGSLGLRLLPGAAPARLSGKRERYVFSGGVQLDGVLAESDLGIGPRAGRAQVHAVTQAGCVRQRPDCSAARASAGGFGLMGDGIDGQGFPAVLGLSLAGGAQDNPLRALGAKRWIVRLPRGAEPGVLVVDPADEDLRGFILLPILKSLNWRKDGAHDAIDGCLEGQGGAPRVCGPVLLDTGAAGVAVVNTPVAPDAWPQALSLSFTGGPATPLALNVPRVGGGGDERLPRPLVLAGVQPFVAYEVLYDAERQLIGLRPR